MTSGDRFMVRILENMRFFIFNMLLLDLTLYSFNSVVHQDLTVRQSSSSIQNLIMTNVVGCLIIWEIISMIRLNAKFDFSYTTKVKHQRRGYSLQSLSSQQPGSTTSLVTIIEGQDCLELKYSSLFLFLKDGIREEKMASSLISRYYNLVSLMGLLLFEPILISLQLLPKVQLLLLLIIQIAMTAITLYAGFWLCSFNSYVFLTQNALMDVTLTFLLGVLFVLDYKSEEVINSSGFWITIQKTCIILVLILAITNCIFLAVKLF